MPFGMYESQFKILQGENGPILLVKDGAEGSDGWIWLALDAETGTAREFGHTGEYGTKIHTLEPAIRKEKASASSSPLDGMSDDPLATLEEASKSNHWLSSLLSRSEQK